MSVRRQAPRDVGRLQYSVLQKPRGALDRPTPFFRRQVGSRLQLRRVPELQFQFDESIEHQDRVEQILRDLHEEEARRERERAAAPGVETPPSPAPDERDGD